MKKFWTVSKSITFAILIYIFAIVGFFFVSQAFYDFVIWLMN